VYGSISCNRQVTIRHLHDADVLGAELARAPTVLLELSIDPVEERIDPRLAVGQAMEAFAVPSEPLFANFIFNRVECRDLLQGLLHTLRIVRLRLKEPSARVHPTLSVRQAEFLRMTVVGGVAVGQQHGTRRMVYSQHCRNNLATFNVVSYRIDMHMRVISTIVEELGVIGVRLKLVRHLADASRADVLSISHSIR
jgi:hypothetical protein